MSEIKSELSHKNKYWISKHRYYELKHFCLQYNEWKQKYRELSPGGVSSSGLLLYSDGKEWLDPTGELASELAVYAQAMDLIKRCCIASDSQIWNYIFMAVTEGVSFTILKSSGIPCERDMYYDRYRRFFWLLSNEKGL